MNLHANSLYAVLAQRRNLPLLLLFSIIGLAILWTSGAISFGKPTIHRPSQTVLETPWEQLGLGAQASAAELLELADKQLMQLLADFPASAEAYNAKADRDFAISNMSAAQESWTTAAKLGTSEGKVEAIYGLAIIAFENGQYDSAIGMCEELQCLSPDNSRIPLLLADSYIHQGKLQAAILVLEQHLSQATASVQALEMLGNAQLKSRHPQLAVNIFQQVLEFAPESRDAHYGLAQAWARLGDREKARVYSQSFDALAKGRGSSNMEAARSFEDRDFAASVAAQVFFDVGTIYGSQSMGAALEPMAVEGVEDLAIKNMLRAVRLNPSMISWLGELKHIYAVCGDRWGANDVGEKLAELEPAVVDHWLNIGQLYAELELSELAIKAFQKAIEISPSDSRCQQAKAVIEKLETK